MDDIGLHLGIGDIEDTSHKMKRLDTNIYNIYHFFALKSEIRCRDARTLPEMFS